MPDLATTVAIVATSLSTIVLTVGRLVARRNPSCDYRHNQMRMRLDRTDSRLDEVEGRMLETEDAARELHRSVTILSRRLKTEDA